MKENYDIVIVGAGPAGLFSAITISKNNRNLKIALIEKNNEVGKKLKITGKGRCNLTSNVDIEEFKNYVLRNPKFLYKAFKEFTNIDLMNFFEKEGISFFSEGAKIFPKSEKSTDIINALYKKLKKYKINLFLNEKFEDFQIEDKIFVRTSNKYIETKILLITTGGASFKETGSDGYGIKLLQEKGIKVNKILPTLVKINLHNEDLRVLKGISLPNAKIRVFENKKLMIEKGGELIFTHTGIGGPLAINLSSYISGKDFSNLDMYLDMAENISSDFIVSRLREKEGKNIINKLSEYVPKNILKELYKDCLNIDFNNTKKLELNKIVDRIKNIELKIQSLGSMNEARVTRGGVDVKEVNPSTMELKKLPNIFVAGEIIDVDALTGGYNLQIAFSTGFLAGESIAEKLKLHKGKIW